MKVLFIGDVVGAVGRDLVSTHVPQLRKSENLDFVIANGENVAGGMGIDEKSALELLGAGVDLITGGNHSWDKKDVIPFMAREKRLIRPANYPEYPGLQAPGRGHAVLESKTGGARLGVLNLMGRVFMDPLDDPFAVGSKWLDWFSSYDVHCVLVDFHAEASSEKQAFAHFAAGRVSAVVGTHTHVPTADERLITGSGGRKTAYITDAGMTGPYDSVIGMRKEKSIQKFLTKLSQRFEAAQDDPQLHGVIIDIDEATGSARSIERVTRTLG